MRWDGKLRGMESTCHPLTRDIALALWNGFGDVTRQTVYVFSFNIGQSLTGRTCRPCRVVMVGTDECVSVWRLLTWVEVTTVLRISDVEMRAVRRSKRVSLSLALGDR